MVAGRFDAMVVTNDGLTRRGRGCSTLAQDSWPSWRSPGYGGGDLRSESRPGAAQGRSTEARQRAVDPARGDGGLQLLAAETEGGLPRWKVKPWPAVITRIGAPRPLIRRKPEEAIQRESESFSGSAALNEAEQRRRRRWRCQIAAKAVLLGDESTATDQPGGGERRNFSEQTGGSSAQAQLMEKSGLRTTLLPFLDRD